MRTPIRAGGRQPLRANSVRVKLADPMPVPPPVGGWDAISSLQDMPPDRAVVLDNWFPSTSDVRVRGGNQIHAGGMGGSVVESLLIYNGATSATSKMFAAANSTIYDVTTAGQGTSSVTSLANNRWQWTNFSTSGGHYLWICNGADAPQHYDGSSWATPSLTVTTFSAADIINVNAHKNRLWFVFKNSMTAGYLPVNSIAGTITNFPLGAIFTKGGFLVAMATWTKDAGNGEDDYAVFLSSEGQAAVYQGTDPSDATLWSLVGTFDLGPPIGYRCITKVAGDLALVNIDGVLPLSKALIQDRGAAAKIAITANINNAMNEAARSYKSNFGWQLMPYPRGTYVLLNVPIQEGQTQHQYVMNTLTGAWCRFTNQNANCWAVFRDNLYFGSNEGTVNQADTTGLDLSTPVDAIGQTAYNYFKPYGGLKQWTMLQPLLTTDSDARPFIGISTDFKDNAVLGTPSSASTISALYDSAIWDTDVYAVENRSVADWSTISGIGQCASLHFRSRTGRGTGVGIWGVDNWGAGYWSYPISGEVVMRLNGFNALYNHGGVL